MAPGIWTTSNNTPSLSWADAYATDLHIAYTCSIDRNLKSSRHITALYLSWGRWSLHVSAGDTISSKGATHFSSSSTIHADNPFISLPLFSFIFPFRLWHLPSLFAFNQLSHHLCRASRFDRTRFASITTSRPSLF